jgi:RNA polymerase sigma factor (sigma-70 family)
MDNQQLTGLIRQAQGGNSNSFAELVDLHYDTIYRFAWKWCGHRTDAEDIAQQACIKLAQSLKQFRFQAAFTSWLYRLVVSVAQDWQRSQKRHLHDELNDEAPAPRTPFMSHRYCPSSMASARGCGKPHCWCMPKA